MLRWLTIDKFSAESGYTPDAVRSKIKRGDWLEGHVWRYAPDGRILIDSEGYEKWVLGQSRPSKRGRKPKNVNTPVSEQTPQVPSKLTSDIGALDVVRLSN